MHEINPKVSIVVKVGWQPVWGKILVVSEIKFEYEELEI